MFTFDCGGWQTEGWEPVGKVSNIAGRQGFLDFDLIDGSGGIKRSGLKVKTEAMNFKFRLRASAAGKMSVSINGIESGEFQFEQRDDFTNHELLMSSDSIDQIESLQLNFTGQKGTTIEVDWIK